MPKWKSGKEHRHDLQELQQFRAFLGDIASGVPELQAYADKLHKELLLARLRLETEAVAELLREPPKGPLFR